MIARVNQCVAFLFMSSMSRLWVDLPQVDLMRIPGENVLAREVDELAWFSFAFRAKKG